MTDVRVSIEIERPAAVVFDYIADMSNNTRWQKGQESCEWTSEPPLRVGSTYDQSARFLGKTIESSFEVVELEAGSRIRIKSTSGTMPIDVARDVEALEEGRCRVSAHVQGTPPLVMRAFGPLLTRMVRSSVRGDYQRLKTLLEED